MKQATRLHDFFHSMVLFHAVGWKKSMCVNMKQTTRLPVRERTCLRATHRQAQTGLHGCSAM
jgi:hypothetical protein